MVFQEFFMNLIKEARHQLGMMKYRIRRQLWKNLKGKVSELQITTRQGKFFVLTKDDSIGGQLYCAQRWDLQEMKSVTDFLRSEGLLVRAEDTLMLDVGANIGVNCIGMLYKKMASRAIAIEAEPGNFEFLARNVALNGMESQISCVHCAVSAEDGFANLQLSVVDNIGDHRVLSTSSGINNDVPAGFVAVPTRRLDDILRERNQGQIPGPRECLTWMDIQAHESFALKGAPEFLKAGNPLNVELWPWGLEKWGGGARQFIDIASEHWTEIVRFEKTGIVRLPIAALAQVFDEIGYNEHDFCNVLLIRK
jgi:FkbM family methyltransferase